MRRWFSSFLFECRHLFAQPLLLALPLLFGAWFLFDLMAIAPPRSEDLYQFAYDFHKVKHTLSLGIAMLIGLLTIRRDMANREYEWLRSTPVSSLTLLITKYLAAFLYLTLFTLAMAILYAGFALTRRLTIGEIGDYLLFFGLQYEISYAVTLALAMSLAIFIKGRIVYLIAFNAWVFGTFFIDLLIIQIHWLFPLEAFHLNHFLVHSLLEHEVWGISLIKEEIWLSRLFVLSFILLLFALIGVFYPLQYRPSGKVKGWGVFAFIALLIAGMAYVPYALLWGDRFQTLQGEREAAYSLVAGVNSARNITLFPVNAYTIHLKVEPDHRLVSQITMEIPSDGVKGVDKIPFTLNHLFQVGEVTIDGSAVPFTRRGDSLLLDKPETSTDGKGTMLVRMTYSGKAAEWSYKESLDRESFLIYADERTLILPDRAAWYPIAGKRAVYVDSYLGLLPIPPLTPFTSHFTLSIEGMRNSVYSSLPEKNTMDEGSGPINKESKSALPNNGRLKALNHGPMNQPFYPSLIGEQSNAQPTRAVGQEGANKQITFAGWDTSLSLYSGNLTKIEVPGAKPVLITAPTNRVEAERFLRRLLPIKQYFEQWVDFPLSPLDTLFYFSPNHLFRDEIDLHHALLEESTFRNLDGNRLSKILNAILFGDRETSPMMSLSPSREAPDSLVDEIRLSFYYLYGREALGRSHRETLRIMEMGPDDKERLFPSPAIRPGQASDLKRMLEMIDKAIQDGNLDRVKEVLNHFRGQGLPMGRLEDYIELHREPSGIYAGMIRDLPIASYPRITWGEWMLAWKEAMEGR